MTRPAALIALALSALALTGVAGCADEEGGAQAPPTTSVPPATTVTVTAPAATVQATAPVTSVTMPQPPPDERENAIAAVRASLPDSPYWQGTVFRATRRDDGTICVDRIRDEPGAGRVSYVVVTLPDLTLGEPMDGPCAKAEENGDRLIRLGQQFYLAMDDDAIALDEAVSDLQDGSAGARGRVVRLEDAIRSRLNAYLLRGGDDSYGANLLLSSAVTALDQSDDLAALARVRRDIAEARNSLADEVIP